jgi:hypothetical protein
LKRIVYHLFFCALFGIGAIVALYLFSEQKSRKPGNFIRKISPHQLVYVRDIRLEGGGWILAGAYASRILVYNTDRPTQILRFDTSLLFVDTVRLHFQDKTELFSATVQVSPDSGLYLFDGQQGAVFRKDHHSDTMRLFHVGGNFIKSLPISRQSVLLSIYDTVRQQAVFRKFRLDNQALSEKVFVPQMNQEGIFSVDGHFCYNAEFPLVGFAYFYRNEFVILDSSLTPRLNASTIDPTKTVSLHLIRQKNKKRTFLAGFDPVLNKECETYGNRLFIRSGAMAKNELSSLTKNCTAIDMYSLPVGTYLKSFYVCKFRGQALRSFLILGHCLVGLHGSFLTVYRLKD